MCCNETIFNFFSHFLVSINTLIAKMSRHPFNIYQKQVKKRFLLEGFYDQRTWFKEPNGTDGRP